MPITRMCGHHLQVAPWWHGADRRSSSKRLQLASRPRCWPEARGHAAWLRRDDCLDGCQHGDLIGDADGNAGRALEVDEHVAHVGSLFVDSESDRYVGQCAVLGDIENARGNREKNVIDHIGAVGEGIGNPKRGDDASGLAAHRHHSASLRGLTPAVPDDAAVIGAAQGFAIDAGDEVIDSGLRDDVDGHLRILPEVEARCQKFVGGAEFPWRSSKRKLAMSTVPGEESSHERLPDIVQLRAQNELAGQPKR